MCADAEVRARRFVLSPPYPSFHVIREYRAPSQFLCDPRRTLPPRIEKAGHNRTFSLRLQTTDTSHSLCAHPLDRGTAAYRAVGTQEYIFFFFKIVMAGLFGSVCSFGNSPEGEGGHRQRRGTSHTQITEEEEGTPSTLRRKTNKQALGRRYKINNVRG